MKIHSIHVVTGIFAFRIQWNLWLFPYYQPPFPLGNRGFCQGPLRITCEVWGTEQVRRRQACSQDVRNQQERPHRSQDVSSWERIMRLRLALGRIHGLNCMSCTTAVFDMFPSMTSCILVIFSNLLIGSSSLLRIWELFLKKNVRTSKLRS